MNLKRLLIIYVDDFKLAGTEANLEKGWALLRTKLNIGPEGPLGMYLGCNQKREQITLHGGILANCVIYDMESFLEQCVNKYLEVAPVGTKMKEAKTPFLQDEGDHGQSRNPTANTGKCCEWCGYVASNAVSQVGGDGTHPNLRPREQFLWSQPREQFLWLKMKMMVCVDNLRMPQLAS